MLRPVWLANAEYPMPMTGRPLIVLGMVSTFSEPLYPVMVSPKPLVVYWNWACTTPGSVNSSSSHVAQVVLKCQAILFGDVVPVRQGFVFMVSGFSFWLLHVRRANAGDSILMVKRCGWNCGAHPPSGAANDTLVVGLTAWATQCPVYLPWDEFGARARRTAAGAAALPIQVVGFSSVMFHLSAYRLFHFVRNVCMHHPYKRAVWPNLSRTRRIFLKSAAGLKAAGLFAFFRWMNEARIANRANASKIHRNKVGVVALRQLRPRLAGASEGTALAWADISLPFIAPLDAAPLVAARPVPPSISCICLGTCPDLPLAKQYPILSA